MQYNTQTYRYESIYYYRHAYKCKLFVFQLLNIAFKHTSTLCILDGDKQFNCVTLQKDST